MSTNIYDVANELERAIRNLPEYKAAEVAKLSVEGNPEAKQILDNYVTYQKTLQEQLQAGKIPDGDVQAKMQEFSKQVQGNVLLTEYFSKQQQLSIYIADLEKIIFKPLQDLL